RFRAGPRCRWRHHPSSHDGGLAGGRGRRNLQAAGRSVGLQRLADHHHRRLGPLAPEDRMTQALAKAVQKSSDSSANLRVGIVEAIESNSSLTVNVGGGHITEMPYLAS